MDYLAKLFFRSYEYALSFPEDISIGEDFFQKSFQEFIPFTPYTIGDFTKFDKKLSEKFQKSQINSLNNRKKSKSTSNDIEFNSNTLHKLSREYSDSLNIKNSNKLSSAFLFYSISYTALRDVYQELESYNRRNSPSDTTTIKFPEEEIAQCLMIAHSIIEYMVNKKYRIQIHEIPKLILDSGFGYRAAATKNSKNWLWCSKCMRKGTRSIFVNEKCPRCKNSRKKVSKIDFNSIRTMKYNVISELVFMQDHRSVFIAFMNSLSYVIKNEPDVNHQYISYFKKYENQIFNSESSYLKKYNFRMCHYNSENSSKKKSHSLTEKEILDSNLIDREYLKEIHSFLKNPSGEGIIRINRILYKYNYPKEFIREKILNDVLRMQIYFNFQNRIITS